MFPYYNRRVRFKTSKQKEVDPDQPPHGITSSPLHICTPGSWQRPPSGVQSLGATQKHPSTSLPPSSVGFPSQSSTRDTGGKHLLHSWYLHHCSLPACISRVTASTAVQLPPLSMALLSKLLR